MDFFTVKWKPADLNVKQSTVIETVNNWITLSLIYTQTCAFFYVWKLTGKDLVSSL